MFLFFDKIIDNGKNKFYHYQFIAFWSKIFIFPLGELMEIYFNIQEQKGGCYEIKIC